MTQLERFSLTGMKHAWTEVNQIRLHYVHGGKEDAPTLILLHGFPQTWLTWRLMLPALTEQYYIVAIDLRGYGDSEKTEGETGYDKGTMAADILALIQHLGLERVILVGHDRGGRVARRFSLDYPEQVAGVVLLDILPIEYLYDELNTSEFASRYWHWMFHSVPDLPERLIIGREEDYLHFFFARAPEMLDLMHADGTWDEYVRIWKQPGTVKAFLNEYRATYAVDLPRYREERASGRCMTTPTLLLWGERGGLAGKPVLEIWRKVATHVQGTEIAGCGHYLPEEQPFIINQHVLHFATDCFKNIHV